MAYSLLITQPLFFFAQIPFFGARYVLPVHAEGRTFLIRFWLHC